MEELKPDYLQEGPGVQPVATGVVSGQTENAKVYLALGAAFVAAVIAAIAFSPSSFLLAAVACAAAYYAHRSANPAKAWLMVSAGASVLFVFGFISARLSIAAQSSRPWTPSGPPPTLDAGVWLWLMPLAGLVTVVAFIVGDIKAYRVAGKKVP